MLGSLAAFVALLGARARGLLGRPLRRILDVATGLLLVALGLRVAVTDR